VELRPLGFGEIFDRAITLYIRNFIPIAGIVSVVIVPLAVLQYFLDLASMPQWDQIVQILTHPSKAQSAPPVLPAIFTEPSVAALFCVLLLLVWAVWPFALNACTVGVARLYRGRPVDFAACYRASLRPWPAVLGLLVVEAAADRPANADPLDIGDHLDWLEPTLVLDPAKVRAAVEKYRSAEKRL